MPRLDSPRARWLTFLILVPLLVAADQISKSWIRTYPEGTVIFRQGFFRIVHIENPGAGFGILQGYSSALMVLGFVALAAILFYLIFLFGRTSFLNNWSSWLSLSLVFAGTAGNLIDRVNPATGGVTDFVYVGFWPAFNVADSAITVGVILMACSLLFVKQKA